MRLSSERQELAGLVPPGEDVREGLLVRGFFFGGQAAPLGHDLVEAEADDLALDGGLHGLEGLGSIDGHGAMSAGGCDGDRAGDGDRASLADAWAVAKHGGGALAGDG